MHCLLCDDVPAFKQMRVYFINPVKETYPIFSTLNTCQKSSTCQSKGEIEMQGVLIKKQKPKNPLFSRLNSY